MVAMTVISGRATRCGKMETLMEGSHDLIEFGRREIFKVEG